MSARVCGEKGGYVLEEKHFFEWIEVKEGLHTAARLPKIKEGEIWWAGLGENVGVEMNGKGERFARPIVIVKKLSRYHFIGVPLTSKLHYGTWYTQFEFLGKMEIAALAQVRAVSVSRLYRKMGQLPVSDLLIIKNGLLRLLIGRINKNAPI